MSLYKILPQYLIIYKQFKVHQPTFNQKGSLKIRKENANQCYGFKV